MCGSPSPASRTSAGRSRRPRDPSSNQEQGSTRFPISRPRRNSGRRRMGNARAAICVALGPHVRKNDERHVLTSNVVMTRLERDLVCEFPCPPHEARADLQT